MQGMKDLGLLNPENVSEEEARTYPVREAVRAVVIDNEDKIALLHVSKRNYYKLMRTPFSGHFRNPLPRSTLLEDGPCTQSGTSCSGSTVFFCGCSIACIRRLLNEAPR